VTGSLIASVIALCLGIAALVHTAGWHVNANAMSAAGAFVAALVALTIAVWGWHERKQERNREDTAQAALVIAEPAQVEHQAALGAFIQNFGTLPVLNVKLAKLDIAGQPETDPGSSETRAFLQPYRHGQGSCWFECRHLNDAGALPLDQATRITATIWFEDAKGNQWESTFESRARSSQREVGRVESPRRISPPRRR
jgi:hypothetical protein